MNVGASIPMCGGTNPYFGAQEGRMRVDWSTGAIGYDHQTRSTGFLLSVVTDQGKVPYWGDQNHATFCRYIHANCQNFDS